MIHTLGVGLGDAWPQLRGAIMVGHQEPLLTGLALAGALDLLVNEQDPHLTTCTKDRVYLSATERELSAGYPHTPENPYGS